MRYLTPHPKRESLLWLMVSKASFQAGTQRRKAVHTTVARKQREQLSADTACRSQSGTSLSDWAPPKAQ